jgi:hypothetical protein
MLPRRLSPDGGGRRRVVVRGRLFFVKKEERPPPPDPCRGRVPSIVKARWPKLPLTRIFFFPFSPYKLLLLVNRVIRR